MFLDIHTKLNIRTKKDKCESEISYLSFWFFLVYFGFALFGLLRRNGLKCQAEMLDSFLKENYPTQYFATQNTKLSF
jgi:hypothetical protein